MTSATMYDEDERQHDGEPARVARAAVTMPVPVMMVVMPCSHALRGVDSRQSSILRAGVASAAQTSSTGSSSRARRTRSA